METMPPSRYVKLSILLATSGVILVSLAICSKTPDLMSPDPGSRHAAPAILSPTAENSAVAREPTPGIVLQVGDPLDPGPSDAFAFVIPEPTSRFTIVAERFSADDQGLIRLPPSSAGSLVGVGGTDRALTAVELPDQDPGEPIGVELAAGHALTVRVADSTDQPLEDVAVYVYPVGTALLWTPDISGAALGNPASKAPLHIGRTNHDGEATVSHLPPGDYQIATSVRGACPEIDTAVAVPGSRPTIRLETAVGIVALPASDARIVYSRIEPSRNAGGAFTFGRSACAWRESRWLQATLEREHPGSAVLVGFASPGADRRVDVTAILDDGSIARGTWALLPVQDVRPVYLAVESALGAGGLTVRLTHGGRAVPGVPLELYAGRSADLPPVQTESDAVVRLPAGRWAILAPGMPWLESLLEAHAAIVRAGVDTEVVVEVPAPLIPLTLSVRAAHGDLDVPYHLTYSHDPSGHGGGSMNMSPEQPDFVQWVPAGTIRARVVAAGFEPAEASLDLDADDRSGRIMLMLRRP